MSWPLVQLIKKEYELIRIEKKKQYEIEKKNKKDEYDINKKRIIIDLEEKIKEHEINIKRLNEVKNVFPAGGNVSNFPLLWLFATVEIGRGALSGNIY